MESEPARGSTRIELHLHADTRFLSGIAGAISHFSDRAGLNPSTQAAFYTAVEQAFRAIAPLLPARNAMFEMIVEDFPDRVEVTLEHEGRPWPAVERKFPQADRARAESSGNFSRLILTKYVRPPN